MLRDIHQADLFGDREQVETERLVATVRRILRLLSVPAGAEGVPGRVEEHAEGRAGLVLVPGRAECEHGRLGGIPTFTVVITGNRQLTQSARKRSETRYLTVVSGSCRGPTLGSRIPTTPEE
jgi:hypothetical protein